MKKKRRRPDDAARSSVPRRLVGAELAALDEREHQRIYDRMLDHYEVIEIIDTGPGGVSGYEGAGWPTLRRRAESGEWFVIIAMMLRPGAAQLITQLEHQLYPPGTPLNVGFQHYHVKFRGECFAVTLVPIKDRERVTRFVEARRMRLADGIPAIIEGGGMHFMPIGDKEWMRTVENVEGSPVYEMTSAAQRQALEIEHEQIVAFLLDRQRTRQQAKGEPPAVNPGKLPDFLKDWRKN